MDRSLAPILPVFLFMVCAVGLAGGLLIVAGLFRPARAGRVARMPYESGMDPIHDTRRRFDVRFHLLAIAFLIFDVELLFLYPWAVCCGEAGAREAVASGQWSVASDTKAEGGGRRAEETARTQDLRPKTEGRNPEIQKSQNPSSSHAARPHFTFGVAMTFVALLTLGFVYDWRKGVFQWR